MVPKFFGSLAGLALCTTGLGAQAQGTQDRRPADPLAILASVMRTGQQPARPKAAAGILQRSEYSLQLTGLLSLSSRGALTSNIVPNTVGFLLGMRIHLNPWEALEVEFGSTNNGSSYTVPPSASSKPADAVAAAVQMNRISVNEVITTSSTAHLEPFLLAGGGAAEFQPHNRTTAMPRAQVRGVAVVGAGLNIHFVHFGIRAEIEGLFYKTPDFHNPAVRGMWTHVAQPSAGLVFSF